MPSTSAKQHRFMAAIAHSPSFAKKVGVSQSVGKDFTAADKGKTFKKGGMMKKRRFDEGGEIDYEVDENAEPERRSFGAGVSRKAEAPKAKSFAKTSSKSISDTSDMGPQEDSEDTRAVSGMASRKYKFKGTDADKERNAERIGKIGEAAALALPVGRVAKGVYDVGKAANAARRFGEAKNLAAPEAEAFKKFSDMPRKAIKTPSAKKFEKQINSGEIALKKGGMMKESKAMVGKEMAFMKNKGAPKSMIKHEKAEMMGMKKGGMPMKDGKPMFMKKMNMGGMSSYAKGGGIESRGKTKGTMVRMATGGSVSSASRRADGIAQRGKTRC